jgi:hypothetical protein
MAVRAAPAMTTSVMACGLLGGARWRSDEER